MKLICIPFSDVREALARREAKWNEERTDSFNTACHDHVEIASVLPDIDHTYPKSSADYLNNWLLIIAASKRVACCHTIELSQRCVSAIVAARNSWTLWGDTRASTMEDLIECFPTTAMLSTEFRPTFRQTAHLDIAALLAENDFFVRLDFCSLKDGRGPAIPRTIEDLIGRIVSSLRACRALEDALEPGVVDKVRLYLLPFRVDIDLGREYRVFCPPGIGVHRITAISQYRWHEPWPGGATGETPEQAGQRILDGAMIMHDSIVRHALALKEDGDASVMDSLEKEGFTFDVFDTGSEVQLVEVNPFGAMSGCGSCLFHWIRDAETLYGKKEDVEVKLALE
ncbi:hypothetical protein MMC10_009472 [Thelotrema lepadinum]|nr:hypothetical protein [Thelotrema lepadinum]